MIKKILEFSNYDLTESIKPKSTEWLKDGYS